MTLADGTRVLYGTPRVNKATVRAVPTDPEHFQDPPGPDQSWIQYDKPVPAFKSIETNYLAYDMGPDQPTRWVPRNSPITVGPTVGGWFRDSDLTVIDYPEKPQKDDL